MKIYPMLIAAEHNWDEMAPGDWAGTTWTIYSDGTYIIEYKIYEPKAYTLKKTKKPRIKSGKMSMLRLSRLKGLLDNKQWRDPRIINDDDDGKAWEMNYYSEDGQLINSSGKMDYIYGHRVLEEIAEALPNPHKIGALKAFFRVKFNR